MFEHIRLVAYLFVFGAISFGVVVKAQSYVDKCTTRYFEQPKDHFAFRPNQPVFKQRVLYNIDHYRSGGPIFFYFGNEANVELYVEHTGLMWENAARFKAALVFAEHRYYGKSRLFPDDACDMSLLTTEQAMRDYAVVMDAFKNELAASAVIGFGGSYGGMLATVFKFQYPHLVDGVIAASASVLAYQGLHPPYDPNGFARIVTKDAGPKCANLVKTGLKSMFVLGKSTDGLASLSKTFQTCSKLKNENEALELIEWVASAFDYLAMGDYPYPSTYVQPDGALLPAYPVKAVCKVALMEKDPIQGLAAGINLFYNATKAKKCFFNNVSPKQQQQLSAFSKRVMGSQRRLMVNTSSSRQCEGTWDWQWCTEHNMPFTSGTDQDMFFPPTGPFDPVETAKSCKETWGVTPNPAWASLSYGGIEGLKRGLNNVVFSNGLLDPWSAGGILDTEGFDPSVVAILIPNGAHHLDLMFSNNVLDPLDVRVARVKELYHIEKWINQARRKNYPNDKKMDETFAVVQ